MLLRFIAAALLALPLVVSAAVSRVDTPVLKTSFEYDDVAAYNPPAGNDRITIVAVQYQASSGGPYFPVTAVANDENSENATLIGEFETTPSGNGTVMVSVWYFKENQISGNDSEYNITLTANPSEYRVYFWTYEDVDQTTPIVSGSVDTGNGSLTSGDISTDVTGVEADDFAVWVGTSSGGGDVTWSGDATEVYDTAVYSTMRLTMAEQAVTSTGTKTGTASAASGSFSHVAFGVAAAAVASDTTAPTYGTAPAIDSFTNTTIVVDATASDETASTVNHYAVAVADGATAPSVSQIVAGSGGGIVAAGNSLSVTNGAEATVTLTGLTQNTAYDVYYVISDGTNNSTATKLDQTTANVTLGVTTTLVAADGSTAQANLTNLIWNVRSTINAEATLAKGTAETTDGSGVIVVTGALGSVGATVYLTLSDSTGTKLAVFKLTVIDTNA